MNFAVGRCSRVKPRVRANALDFAIEMLNEDAYHECGEASELWPDLSGDDVRELEAVVSDWVLARARAIFTVVDIEELWLTQDGGGP
jgi:hypothetical protein